MSAVVLFHVGLRGKVDAVVDVQSILCREHCRVFTPGGQLMYVDYGHLTWAGSRFLAAQIAARSRYAAVFPAAPLVSSGRTGGSGP